jgi:hypothetical protein
MENNIPEGFISLIEYEQKYDDKILIAFPSSFYRKGNILYKKGTFYNIESIEKDYLTGYRIPKYKEVNGE